MVTKVQHELAVSVATATNVTIPMCVTTVANAHEHARATNRTRAKSVAKKLHTNKPSRKHVYAYGLKFGRANFRPTICWCRKALWYRGHSAFIAPKLPADSVT